MFEKIQLDPKYKKKKSHFIIKNTFRKNAVKSTILVLEQSFLHIFGVAQNFQLNGEGSMAQKGGG